MWVSVALPPALHLPKGRPFRDISSIPQAGCGEKEGRGGKAGGDTALNSPRGIWFLPQMI